MPSKATRCFPRTFWRHLFQIHRHKRQSGRDSESGLRPAIGIPQPGLFNDEHRNRAAANHQWHGYDERFSDGVSPDLGVWQTLRQFRQPCTSCSNLPAAEPALPQMAPAARHHQCRSTCNRPSDVAAGPEAMAQARAALLQKLAELKAQDNDTRVHVVSTNAGPRFDVDKYLVMGNTVLPPEAIAPGHHQRGRRFRHQHQL